MGGGTKSGEGAEGVDSGREARRVRVERECGERVDVKSTGFVPNMILLIFSSPQDDSVAEHLHLTVFFPQTEHSEKQCVKQQNLL